jgi:hypothetical protein
MFLSLQAASAPAPASPAPAKPPTSPQPLAASGNAVAAASPVPVSPGAPLSPMAPGVSEEEGLLKQLDGLPWEVGSSTASPSSDVQTGHAELASHPCPSRYFLLFSHLFSCAVSRIQQGPETNGYEEIGTSDGLLFLKPPLGLSWGRFSLPLAAGRGQHRRGSRARLTLSCCLSRILLRILVGSFESRFVHLLTVLF